MVLTAQPNNHTSKETHPQEFEHINHHFDTMLIIRNTKMIINFEYRKLRCDGGRRITA